MRDADGYPCGMYSNEKAVSTTDMAYRYRQTRALSAKWQKLTKEKDMSAYRKRMADRKRQERKRKAELMEVFERYGMGNTVQQTATEP